MPIPTWPVLFAKSLTFPAPSARITLQVDVAIHAPLLPPIITLLDPVVLQYPAEGPIKILPTPVVLQ